MIFVRSLILKITGLIFIFAFVKTDKDLTLYILADAGAKAGRFPDTGGGRIGRPDALAHGAAGARRAWIVRFRPLVRDGRRGKGGRTIPQVPVRPHVAA